MFKFLLRDVRLISLSLIILSAIQLVRMGTSSSAPQQLPEVKTQQSSEPVSDQDNEYEILSYVDNSFENDLRFINGRIRNRRFTCLSGDPYHIRPEVEKCLYNYIVILWSLEAYSVLVTGISPEDTFEIKKFVEKKLSDFGKGSDLYFSPELLLNSLRKVSESRMTESDFAERDSWPAAFKVKIVKDEKTILRRKKIINELMTEVKLKLNTLGI